jgi:transposase
MHAHVLRLVSVVKVVTLLKECTPEEQLSVVRFVWAIRLNAKDIHKGMFSVYGGKCLSCKAVHDWVEKFPQGHLKVTDNARPGRPVKIATEATGQRVEELIEADKRITIDSVATALGCTHGLAYSIMHSCLKLWKVCAGWVPRELKDW